MTKSRKNRKTGELEGHQKALTQEVLAESASEVRLEGHQKAPTQEVLAEEEQQEQSAALDRKAGLGEAPTEVHKKMPGTAERQNQQKQEKHLHKRGGEGEETAR